ncbi:MAG: LPS-assembly protein LptD [Hyphomonadaceae bacterium]
MIRPEGQPERAADKAPARWAAIAAALAVTALPQLAHAQSPAPSGPTAPDSNVVLLEADTLDEDDHAKTITAAGDVQVRYQDRTMRADRMIYNLTDHTVLAQGNVQLVEADGAVTYAEEMQVDSALGIGIATNLRTRFAHQGALAARTAIRHGPRSNELSRVIYTSCPICEDGSRPPTWQLKARRAIQNQESRLIAYHGVTLEVLGAPVLYLPYFAHPDPTGGPQSGFLPPDLGSNSRLGAYYSQPYYWRISPYSDLTAAMRVHANVNPLLGFEYRKRFYSGDMSVQATFTYDRDFDGDGNRFGEDAARGSLFARGRFRINDYWNWGFGIERISDDLYLRRYGVPGAGENRGPYLGDSARLVSQVFAIGQDRNSYGAISFLSFQGLRETDSADLTPLILPTADYERVFHPAGLGGQLKWRSNLTVLERSVGYSTARASSGVTWRAEHVFGPGWVVSPFAEARGDVFHIDTPTYPNDTFGRATGLAGAEASWPFMRPGDDFDVIVEPVVMAAYGSQGGNNPEVLAANEDSIGFELDDSNLFRPNGAPNYDLWEPGTRMAAGVRATARDHSGRNASFLFGRRFRAEADSTFTPLNNLGDRASDYIAAGQIDLGRNFGAIVRTRIDDRTLDVSRVDAEVRSAVWRLDVYGRYFSVDDTLNPSNPGRELQAAVGLRLERGWRVQFGVRRDLDSNTNLSQELRAIYEDDCTFLEFAYTKSDTVDRRLGPDEGVRIRFGLRSLGAGGRSNGY